MYHISHLLINKSNVFERFVEGSAQVVSWNAILSIALAIYPERKTVVFALIETLFAFGYMLGKKYFSPEAIQYE